MAFSVRALVALVTVFLAGALVYQTVWVARASPKHARNEMNNLLTELVNIRSVVDAVRSEAKARQGAAAPVASSAAPAVAMLELTPFEAGVLSALVNASISTDNARAAIRVRHHRRLFALVSALNDVSAYVHRFCAKTTCPQQPR